MATTLNNNIKEKIITNTACLLGNSSFDEISLAKIAKKCEISKGTLYYYYTSKDDILFDVAVFYLNRLADELISWSTNKEKDTSLPRLMGYVLRKGAFNESGSIRLYLVAAAVSGHESVRKKLIEKYSYFQNIISQKIKERDSSLDSDYLAWLILCVMDGILIQTSLNHETFNAEDFINKTVKLMQK